MRKPWHDEDWLSTYATRVCEFKSIDPARSNEVRLAVTRAFRKVYRAVAFDVDGTLTAPHTTHVDDAMKEEVYGLLARAVPVIFITGRGRSTRRLCEELRDQASLSKWYFRRLYCVVHNGCLLLSTPAEDPSKFLQDEDTLIQSLPDLDGLRRKVQSLLRDRLSEEPDITGEPYSIRLAFKSSATRDAAIATLQPLVGNLRRAGSMIELVTGSYGALSCVDLSPGRKTVGLERLAQILGIPEDMILRVGDQGQEGGNDHDLLNSPFGFSVGEFSNNAHTCHPVLNNRLDRALGGAGATARLLTLVHLFSPLSLSPDTMSRRIGAMLQVERLALSRASQERSDARDLIRLRFCHILRDPQALRSRGFALRDVYDPTSGGVRMREWELRALPQNHSALALFEIPEIAVHRDQPTKTRWCMYTDSAMLLRGPMYYLGLVDEPTVPQTRDYVGSSNEFLGTIPELLTELAGEPPDILRLKVLLAVQDNVRNICLRAFNVTYAGYCLGIADRALLIDVYERVILPHTEIQYRWLFGRPVSWELGLQEYRRIVTGLASSVDRIGRFLTEYGESHGELRRALAKWREADDFIQNVSAAHLGINGHFKHLVSPTGAPVWAVALMYGGAELPAIINTIARMHELNLLPAVVRVSRYNDEDVSETVRQGDYDRVVGLLERQGDVTALVQKAPVLTDQRILLLDDSCTTCTTLQMARDLMLLRGADVLGAIVVRFPGMNRALHMSLPGHGSPDPEVLFSVVRGLVGPSPYSRLQYRNEGPTEYKDVTGVFDKAKRRIRRYIGKTIGNAPEV